MVLGDFDLTKPDEGEQAVPVSRILPHPKVSRSCPLSIIPRCMTSPGAFPHHASHGFSFFVMQFNPKTFHNDVALLELSSPVAASAWVAPVCLPEQPAELGMGTLCYIVGWGSLYEGRGQKGHLGA